MQASKPSASEKKSCCGGDTFENVCEPEKKEKTTLPIYFKVDYIHLTFTEIVQYLKKNILQVFSHGLKHFESLHEGENTNINGCRF